MRELRGWSMANMDLAVPSRCAVARSNLWDDEEKPYDKTFAFPVENPLALREPIPFKPAHGQQGLPTASRAWLNTAPKSKSSCQNSTPSKSGPC